MRLKITLKQTAPNVEQDSIYVQFRHGPPILLGYLHRQAGSVFCTMLVWHDFDDEDKQLILKQLFKEIGERKIACPLKPPPWFYQEPILKLSTQGQNTSKSPRVLVRGGFGD